MFAYFHTELTYAKFYICGKDDGGLTRQKDIWTRKWVLASDCSLTSKKPLSFAFLKLNWSLLFWSAFLAPYFYLKIFLDPCSFLRVLIVMTHILIAPTEKPGSVFSVQTSCLASSALHSLESIWIPEQSETGFLPLMFSLVYNHFVFLCAKNKKTLNYPGFVCLFFNWANQPAMVAHAFNPITPALWKQKQVEDCWVKGQFGLHNKFQAY